MPDRSLTVATYAAGASLAAITLIYVFAPTYFLDSDQPTALAGVFGSRKKGIVGLSNPANDCFINSVLQALAGLNDLRVYLIQETHRRSLDDGQVYTQLVPIDTTGRGGVSGSQPRKRLPEWKLEGQQMGIVTKGLKDILDALNERPLYKKTISAGPFVRILEQAFRQRISRQQQDAQEFLQVVAERLCDEYHAGRRARRFARDRAILAGVGSHPLADTKGPDGKGVDGDVDGDGDGDEDHEEGFPLEGEFESQIECLTCGFKPRPTESTFCSLTLNVPQASATTLGACFDGMFKTEYIDDFKCEKCRLVHAVDVLQTKYASLPGSSREEAETAIARLRLAIETDPEKLPEGITLPDARYAPRRRIARHIRLTLFPRILAIHLSRSIYDASNLSQKNSAKVSFPEQLPLGGLLEQKRYRLRGLVTHKGSHHSGHYETFRRQNVYPPFSNSNTFQPSGIYGKPASLASTPTVGALQHQSEESSPLTSVPDLLAHGSGTDSSTRSLTPVVPDTAVALSPTSGPSHASLLRDRDADTPSLRSVALSARSPFSRTAGGPRIDDTGSPEPRSRDTRTAKPASVVEPKRRKTHDRWWRISDEKVKLASTSDVLSMQREVYLLFYELDR